MCSRSTWADVDEDKTISTLRCEGGSLCTVKYNTTNLVNVEYTEDPFAAPGLPPHPECDAAMEKPDTVQKVKCDDTLCESGFASPPSEWYTNGTSSEEFIGCRCVPSPSPPPAPPASPPAPPSLPPPCVDQDNAPCNADLCTILPTMVKTCPMTCNKCTPS